MSNGRLEMESLRKTARIAGVLYLATCLPAPFSLLYVPNALIVGGNAAETASRILASQWMLLAGIAGELINPIAFLFATLALYRLLKSVNQPLASLMVILFGISIPISCLNVLNDFAALMLVRGAAFLSVFTKPQLDALAMVFLRLHGSGVLIAQIFWGLWLLPFGMLVYRSGFIPRFFGVFLIGNGIAYPVQSLTALFLPRYYGVVSRITFPLLLGEVAIILWLLIRGVRDRPLAAVTA
jgi:uncharacterized protein DUF4386